MYKTTRKPRWWRTRGLVIVGLLALCAMVGAFAVAAPTSEAATKATLVKNLNAYMAAWNAHDPAEAASFFAKNGSFLDSTVGTPVVGRENIKNDVIGYFINACPDCKWTRSKARTIVGKNKLSFVWVYTGTNTGAWGPDTPATNKPFRFSGQTFMQFTAAGKILHQYDYYDALGFSKQLGWL